MNELGLIFRLLIPLYRIKHRISVCLLVASVIPIITPSQVCYGVTFTALHNFNRDEGFGVTALIQGKDGKLYGITTGSDTTDGSNAFLFGNVFKIDPITGALTIIHVFNGTDGHNPVALVMTADGTLFGITSGTSFAANDNDGFGSIFRISPTGQFTALHYFKGTDGDGPNALILAKDGNLYGTTYKGGTGGNEGGGGLGTFFRITSAGAFTTLANYESVFYPNGILFQGSDGSFYGTTNNAVYRVTVGGAVTLLHAAVNEADGDTINGLLETANGHFYGTSSRGGNGTQCGSVGCGIAFKLSSAGAYKKIHDFEGGYAAGGLIKCRDGRVFGMAQSSVFEITSADTVKSVHSFTGADGFILTGLIQGSDGKLYGTTYAGGTAGDQANGTLFQISEGGAFTKLHDFEGAGDGTSPRYIILGADGAFYGPTEHGGIQDGGIVFRLSATEPLPALKTLWSFHGADGADPHAALLLAPDGSFYGTTFAGGTTEKGTVFRVTDDGTLTSLVSFTGDNGEGPRAALVRAPDGTFWGTTYSGGSHGDGIVFRMNASGSGQVVYNFSGDDGDRPAAPLLLAHDGNLYGTTEVGGIHVDGTVFRITPAGAFTNLHSLDNDNGEGQFVDAPLIEASDGNFYGTARELFGTVFKITVNGTFTKVFDFQDGNNDPGFSADGNDGEYPVGAVSEGKAGELYGTTLGAGPPTDSDGTVYKLNAAGHYVCLYGFPGQPDFSDSGDGPAADLLKASDGNFYGTTRGNRPSDNTTSDYGTIFKITPAGALTTLHRFSGQDGNDPESKLVQGNDGKLYGTTRRGGASDKGAVFSLDVNLPTPPKPPGRAINISTRMRVLAGDNVLIGGFIVAGTDPKRVIIRGLGPSLPVSGGLADPMLELHDASGAMIATNDNWKEHEADVNATTIPPTNDLESALVASLPANNSGYTAILRDKNGATGIGLVEVYDLDQAANSRLANISTRGFVDTGDNVMIGGFIIGPASATNARVLVRAVGPSLTKAGIANPLQDPTLELHDGNGGIIANNDNWKDSQAAEIEATTVPPSDEKESAILRTLPPGNYTAIVRGKNNTTGIGLVEVYQLP